MAGNEGAPMFWAEDDWTKLDEGPQNSLEVHKREINYVDIDNGRRPVVGILTEPLRGDLYKPS